jgi:hypothetical protein
MKKALAIVVATLAAFQSHACNTCSCAASNQSLGILPQLSGHFIGLQYNYRWYESHHDAKEASKPTGHEYYQTTQLWGRYSLGKRIHFFAFVPFQYNLKREGASQNVLSGLGDITVLANYQIMRTGSTCEEWQHYLQVGVGVKAPTGAYDNTVLGSGDEIAPAMQAGTSSWDFVGNANYTLLHGSWGLNAEAGYTLTTPNHQSYKYGNRMSAGLQFFRQWKFKDLRVLPGLRINYEQSAQEYDNYATRSLAAYTGGNMLYGGATLHAFKKHWGAELQYNQPITQQYAEGLVQSKGKIEAGIVYLF